MPGRQPDLSGASLPELLLPSRLPPFHDFRLGLIGFRRSPTVATLLHRIAAGRGLDRWRRPPSPGRLRNGCASPACSARLRIGVGVSVLAGWTARGPWRRLGRLLGHPGSPAPLASHSWPRRAPAALLRSRSALCQQSRSIASSASRSGPHCADVPRVFLLQTAHAKCA
jgi:hypothetical protein